MLDCVNCGMNTFNRVIVDFRAEMKGAYTLYSEVISIGAGEKIVGLGECGDKEVE